MRVRWDERAARDALRFIESNDALRGDIHAFFRLGEERTRLLIEPALAEFDPKRALAVDVGCGVGRFSRPLTNRFARVVGIDVSAAMIERARELNPPSRYPNLTFQVSDGLSLPVASRSASFVFSYEVFQHMPSQAVIDANLREISRVLAPGGLALLHFPYSTRWWLSSPGGRASYDLLRGLKHRVMKADRLATDPTYRGTPRLPLREVLTACRSAGLEAERMRRDPTHSSSHVFIAATAPPNRSSQANRGAGCG
jgi:SAM-dependent methyltransferase